MRDIKSNTLELKDIDKYIQEQIKEGIQNALKGVKSSSPEPPSRVSGFSNNDILSNRLKVKELREGQMVTYKLVNAGITSPNIFDENDNPKKTSPAGAWIVGEERITDPGDNNRKKLIRNIVAVRSEQASDGTIREIPIVSKIEFNRHGYVSVTDEQFETYIFLERSSKNGSNKYRSKGGRVRYIRLNPTVETENALSKKQLIADAVDMVRNEALTLTELKQIVKNIPENVSGRPSLDSSLENIRLALWNIAERDPKMIINAGPDISMKKKCQVLDAESANVLEFDDNRSWWVEKMNGELEHLCEVPVGEDRYKYLVEFWSQKENQNSYKNMTAVYKKYIDKPKR